MPGLYESNEARRELRLSQLPQPDFWPNPRDLGMPPDDVIDDFETVTEKLQCTQPTKPL